MCDVLDRIENRGIQKGIQKGMREGMQKGLMEGKVLSLHTAACFGRICGANRPRCEASGHIFVLI